MKKKSNNLLLYVISIALVILAIALTAIINNTNKSGGASDVRARAGAANAIKFTATVTGVNEENRTMAVNNLKFVKSESGSGNLGNWTVTVPVNFSLASVETGASVILAVDPTTFKAETHTLTAVEITR